MESNIEKITFPSVLNVTDQEIDVSILNEKQKEFYLELFQEFINIYNSKQKSRVIIALAGPSGSGKSVINSLFKEFSKQTELPFQFETLGIDAFHYSNKTLESLGLKEYKGRFDTYDVNKLLKTIDDFSKGKNVSLPIYSRITHDPVEDSKSISEERVLLLLEGLWLLYDDSGWEKVLPYIDFSFFIDAKKEIVRDLVIKRHVAGGRSIEEASLRYDEIDGKNFDLAMEIKNKADKIIPPYYTI